MFKQGGRHIKWAEIKNEIDSHFQLLTNKTEDVYATKNK